MDLKDIRHEIDSIDGELVRLFERRMALAAEVAAYKKEHGIPVLDTGREAEVLNRAESAVEDKRLQPFARRFFESLMGLSRTYQRNILAPERREPEFPGGRSVAFLGPEGSYSHEAFLLAFGTQATPTPVASFEEIVRLVSSGACARGLLPLENTLTGGVFAAADLLTDGTLRIVGETILPVRHCLLGIPGSVPRDIHTALSHTQPLEQCRQYLLRKGYDTKACASTATAAREVAAKNDPKLAAIGPEAAGKLFGLTVLERDIQDNLENYTRFAVISACEEEIPGADKISAVLTTEHRPGALYGALKAFADRGVNILNLVSRPVKGSPWQYCFHIDLDGNLGEPNIREALKQAGENCRGILLLGNYRKWRGQQ